MSVPSPTYSNAVATVGLALAGVQAGEPEGRQSTYTLPLCSHNLTDPLRSSPLAARPSLGLAIAYPLIINPHYAMKHQGDLLDSPSRSPSLNINQRLTLWERSYKMGTVIPALGLA